MDDVLVIVGLGNPGKRFDNTRHNVGFVTIGYLSARHGIKVTKVKHKALIGDGTIGGKRVLLVKPQTFMNASGESLREIVEWYHTPVSNIIVIQDDIDLPLGKVRVRPKGSAGTHNGMRSIIFQLQDDGFPRVKIGIGGAPEGWDLADYVLGRFSEDEKKPMEESIKRAAEAVETIVKDGIDKAMNAYNGK